MRIFKIVRTWSDGSTCDSLVRGCTREEAQEAADAYARLTGDEYTVESV